MNDNWRSIGSDVGARLRRLGAPGQTREQAASLSRYLPELACLGLVIAIAYALARLTWLAVPGAQNDAALAATSPAVAVVASDGQANAADIASQVAAMHLFGEAAAPTATGPINAPETNLNVTLRGIIAAGDPARSSAIIASGSGQGAEKSYATGARIPGGAVVRNIYADRVILERNGRLEALKLPRSEGGNGGIVVSQSPAAAPVARPAAPARTGRPVHTARHLRGGFQDLLRTQRAVVDGKLVGYRVYPGSNPAEFVAAGLRPGDVIKSVNGQSITNPASLMTLSSKLKQGSSVTLAVERNGRMQQVKVSLPD